MAVATNNMSARNARPWATRFAKLLRDARLGVAGEEEVDVAGRADQQCDEHQEDAEEPVDEAERRCGARRPATEA